jgi:hypothetical protein
LVKNSIPVRVEQAECALNWTSIGFMVETGESRTIPETRTDSPKLDVEKVAKDCGVPFLISIPQTPAVGLLKPYFDRLAKMVLKGHT